MMGSDAFLFSVSSLVAYNQKSLAGGPTPDDYDSLLFIFYPQYARKRHGDALSVMMMSRRSLHVMSTFLIGSKYLPLLLVVGKKPLLTRKNRGNDCLHPILDLLPLISWKLHVDVQAVGPEKVAG